MRASTIARYIVWFAHEHGDPISNLKLQKLLYYAQAWYLALKDRPLFDDPIEAWVHGPVVPNVYREYRDWSWQPIARDVTRPELDSEIVAHLDEVMEAYGGLSAFYLERLTHSERPWRKARGKLPADAQSHAEISQAEMRDYYKARLAKAQAR
jgi:uncharacterized phage-associated protein